MKETAEQTLNAILSNLVEKDIAKQGGSFHYRDAGLDLVKNMRTEDRERCEKYLKKHSLLVLEEKVVALYQRKSKPAPFEAAWRDQGELWPEEMLEKRIISSAKDGERIRYECACWSDHLALKIKQESVLERQTAAYEREEERREEFKRAGMDKDPTMTTRDAFRLLGLIREPEPA